MSSGIQKALAAIKWAHNDMQYCAPEMAAHKYGLWSQKLREALDQLEMERFVESLDEVAAPKPPAEWMEAAAREIMQGELKSVTTPWSVNTTASDEVVAKGIASIIAKHAPKVPEGWQMVPVEPTRDMRDSGGREFLEARDRTSTTEWDDAAIIYKAMIAAAPKGEA